MSPFRPREGQRQILEFAGGLMGVSAVPGSGKTSTIAALAGRLIAEGRAGSGQVLVVTYQNAAVENIRSRIREELDERGLVQAGYDVRTLHSLSYSIIQAHPGLAGAAPEFQVVDERSSNNLLDKAVRIWNNQNEKVWGRLAPGDYYGEGWERDWRRIAHTVARTVISAAKNRRLGPAALNQLVQAEGEEGHSFLRIGAQMYQLYQQQVETIGGLDFNDLVWLAVDLIDSHPDVCQRLAQRWPIILEDEAQDSVPLQEELLGLLSASSKNWIRVGDPNQSIMSTFTAADPRFLRRFLEREEVQTVEMAISGRCALPVIDLANHLVEWTCERHPLVEVRRRAFRFQFIRPTAAGDPQQNPTEDQSDIAFRQYNNRPEELADVARRARKFIENNPEATAGILVTTNRLGYEMSEYLRAAQAPYDEVLQSSESGRRVSEVLAGLVSFLAEPLQANRLEGAYRALRQMWPGKTGAGDQEAVALLLRSCYQPETLLFPAPGRQLTDAIPPIGDIAPADVEAMGALARYLRRWLRAAVLPIDQLIMTIAQDVMSDTELAQAQRIALYMRASAEQNLDWRLPELAREMSQIARGRIKIPGDVDDIFEPRSGRISLMTMHRAKGLEWDLVYLVGVDGSWFPHTLEDHFLGEYEFLGGDPAEEARAALLGLVGAAEAEEIDPTEAAHIEIIAERLRLLYVGITRARRYLVLSWAREVSTRTRTRAVPQAPVFELLQNYYKRK